MSGELTRVEQQLPAVRDEVPVTQMLKAVIAAGVNSESVAALEKLCALHIQIEDRNAKREYFEAMAALQAELPHVNAYREIKVNGVLRSRFAPYEDIMDVVQPYLSRHKFSVGHNTRVETIGGKERVIDTCTLRHAGGHQESNDFAVRAGEGPPGTSMAQADGSTGAYAQRYALCDALNISIRKDDDARAEGGFIAKQQAEDLCQRVHATASNEAAFLKLADATDYENIRTGKLAMLEAMLTKKEAQQQRPPAPAPSPAPATSEKPAGAVEPPADSAPSSTAAGPDRVPFAKVLAAAERFKSTGMAKDAARYRVKEVLIARHGGKDPLKTWAGMTAEDQVKFIEYIESPGFPWQKR
jgi:hypothetical protein